jgi:hypothetical protein
VAGSALGNAVRVAAALIPVAVAGVSTTLPAVKATAPQTTASSTHTTGTATAGVPVPLIATGHPVNWWFVFKLNGSAFPKCGGGDIRSCPFGGTPGGTRKYESYGQQYVTASSDSDTLQMGGNQCLGDSTTDPVGASFDEVYNGNYHYVVWNDQTYQDPKINGCSGDGCDGPWGHSKGMIAWNDAGEGFVMQVTTPSWPASGSVKVPRKTDGNTLGCINDNDVGVSQHFFALRITESDLVSVLKGMANASVVTDPNNPQMVSNGGPDEVQTLVNALGKKSSSTAVQKVTLSSGVQFISKPSALGVPPWQLVSAELGGINLRAATWWATPYIPSTTASTPIGCWNPALGKPGAVDIATSGSWNHKTFSLKSSPSTDGNHAKIGVSTSGATQYAIFGDENQQGAITGDAKACLSSQNGRGGMFFAVADTNLAASVSSLIAGSSAPN